jgi:hypothetical protein
MNVRYGSLAVIVAETKRVAAIGQKRKKKNPAEAGFEDLLARWTGGMLSPSGAIGFNQIRRLRKAGHAAKATILGSGSDALGLSH